ncbi:tetratricopeptide repeat protein [Chiayiivirga flava]|uniref:Tetratricopeptide (TPR) repeat protein n=1 Tax=Chiayiivirga flava TaxID=659595 RepID=A0A7W8D8Q3_9GAMM|nr:tetratricopeptide repeat protein [Chiayiivirga flava]MBB5208847.1 tetratricopeptide (TPR) repeat protein [Chiayiivirga flava]
MSATTPHPRLAEAFERHRAGDLAAAEQAYRAVLAERGEDADALNGLAGLSLVQRRPNQALALLRRALAQRPESAVIWSNLARAALGSGRSEDAARAAQRACELGGDTVDDLLLLGNALRDLDRTDESEAAFERAAQKAPGQLAPAYNLAISHLTAGQHERALRELKALTARFPAQPAVRHSLANALAAVGRHAEALVEYRATTEQSPGFVAAWTNYALTCLEVGELDEAAAALDHALDLRPGEPVAVAAAGVLAQREGDAARIAQLFDVDRVIVAGELPLPAQVPDRQAWHDAIEAEILALPHLRRDLASKTTRDGRQSGNLAAIGHGALGAFVAALRETLAARIDAHASRQHGVDPVLVAPPPARWHLNLWATVLDPAGHQDPHLHPSGWLSGVYYLRAAASPDDRAGWIEFGAPPTVLQGDTPPTVHALQPREGELVTFPSYLYHRTVPHRGDGLRISLAFDVVPLPA